MRTSYCQTPLRLSWQESEPRPGFASVTASSEGKCKPIRHPCSPHIGIACGTEQPAIAARGPQSIHKVIIQSHLGLLGVCPWHRAIGRTGLGEELLETPDQLRASEPWGVGDGTQAQSGLNPVATARLGVSELRTNVQWERTRLPFKMDAEAIRAVLLQQVLDGESDFDALFGQKRTEASTDLTVGGESLVCAEGREVSRVIQIHAGSSRKAAPQHYAVAGALLQGKDQRIGLQISYPSRIKALVKDAEGSEKSSGGDGQIPASDVVELQIFELFMNFSTEGAGSVATGEVSLEGSAGLDQPVVAERHKHYRRDDADERRLSALDERHDCDTARDHRDGRRSAGVGGLGKGLSCQER